MVSVLPLNHAREISLSLHPSTKGLLRPLTHKQDVEIPLHLHRTMDERAPFNRLLGFGRGITSKAASSEQHNVLRFTSRAEPSVDTSKLTVIGLVFTFAVLAFAGAVPGQLHSQPERWSPQKNVEFIVPTAPGSTMDVLARTIQETFQKKHLVDASITVQAKPGSGGAIAWTYVSRKIGDGHYIAISGPT